MSRCWLLPLTGLLLLLPPVGCGTTNRRPATDGPLIVVASTHIYSACRALLDDEIRLELLVPPASCPGHHDLTPVQIMNLSRAKVILVHNFQTGLRSRLAELPELASRVSVVSTPGSLLLPDNHLQLLADTAEILTDRFPGKAVAIDARRARATRHGTREWQRLLNRLRALSATGVTVMCDRWQAEFLSAAGYRIAGTWTGSQDPIPAMLAQPAGTVDLVVGNRQSDGSGTAATLARQWQRPWVVLSNFPDNVAREYDYTDYLAAQVASLEEATRAAITRRRP